MSTRPMPDFSIDRRPSVLGGDDGYDIWFDLAPREGDATTCEFQTLCQGMIVLGFIAARMRWSWPTLRGTIGHVCAPVEGYLLIEVSEKAFYGPQFRKAVQDGVATAGLDPYKVRLSDMERGEVHILGHGLPPV